MRKSASTKASVIAYTPDKEPKEKELFLGEARSVGDFFGVQPLLGKQATAQALSKEARDSKYIHISCHANFTVEDAYGSSLVLADSKFTVRDWMKLRLEADLVSLSACETGVLEQRAADELAGFGRAVLYSGAESALLTLWRVDAETTGIWMKDFYEGIIYNDAKKSSKQKSLAFQKATLNLMEKYDDPFYWSPFILLGA